MERLACLWVEPNPLAWSRFISASRLDRKSLKLVSLRSRHTSISYMAHDTPYNVMKAIGRIFTIIKFSCLQYESYQPVCLRKSVYFLEWHHHSPITTSTSSPSSCTLIQYFVSCLVLGGTASLWASRTSSLALALVHGVYPKRYTKALPNRKNFWTLNCRLCHYVNIIKAFV